MFVPERYVSLGGALKFVARRREPEAVATLTPDGFAFFASLDAALRPRVAPPVAPIRSIHAGPSPGLVRDLRPTDPVSATTAEPSPQAKAEMETQLRRWIEAWQKLAVARDNARADLRHALISGTVRAAAVREDGNLVTMQPLRWRVTFERPRIAGLEPFAEAVAGRTVPLVATADGKPTAWGCAIIARADLARWCGGPPEAEPSERPADWPGPALSPQSVQPIEAVTAQASFPVAPALAEIATIAGSFPAVAKPGQAYSRAALGAWFMLRVNTWPKDREAPTEPECIKEARSYFADLPGRDVIRLIRQQKTPDSWRKRGPRRQR